MADEKAGPRGIYPMLYAFFGADGRLDRQAMRSQVDACLAGGATASLRWA